MMAPVRIAVIDDHPLFREGVKRSLGEIEGFQIVAEGSSKNDAIQISREHSPDVMLLDLSMPGGGLDAITPILEHRPAQRIVVLTVSETSDDVTRALNSGAKGYVLKGIGSRALADVIRTVASGEAYVSPALSARLLTSLSLQGTASKPNPIAELTEREHEVLNLAAAGLSNKRIAMQLDLHEKTIKHHMGRIFAKLGVTNRTEAAMVLRDSGSGSEPAPRPDFSG